MYLIYLQIANIREVVIIIAIILATSYKKKRILYSVSKIGTTHMFLKICFLACHTINWYIIGNIKYILF